MVSARQAVSTALLVLLAMLVTREYLALRRAEKGRTSPSSDSTPYVWSEASASMKTSAPPLFMEPKNIPVETSSNEIDAKHQHPTEESTPQSPLSMLITPPRSTSPVTAPQPSTAVPPPRTSPPVVFKEVAHHAPHRSSTSIVSLFGGQGLAKKRGSESPSSSRSSSLSSSEPKIVINGTTPHLLARRAPLPSSPSPLLLPFSGTYMCSDVSESYGAAWIISRSKFLRTKFGPPWTEPFDLSDMRQAGWSVGNNVTFRSVNMEGATHLVLKLTKGAFKTLDAFDFMVEHLSIYERRLGLLHLPEKVKGPASERVIAFMKKRAEALLHDHNRDGNETKWGVGVDAGSSARTRTNGGGGAEDTAPPPRVGAHVGPSVVPARHQVAWGGASLGDRVVACMPFYGAAVGTGHSMAKTRFAYLNATYLSIARVFKHVAIFVENEADRAYCQDKSGLPFFEVVLIAGLANPKLLGVATVLEMQRKFQSQEWAFDYMYFTESDQVLHLRPHLLADLLHVVDNDREVLAPHRFLPFPHKQDFEPTFYDELKAQSKGLRKELDALEAKDVVRVNAPHRARCCFDRGNCRRRDQWVNFNTKGKAPSNPPKGAAAPQVHLLRTRGSPALLNGEGNLFKMSFRTCQLQDGGDCP